MLVGRAMGPAIVRSSLEVMLETLRQKEEKPTDLMPALPVRPVSRGRLPPSRRPLQVNFSIQNMEAENTTNKEMLASQEDTRDQTLQGVLCVQKHFHSVKARRDFLELKNGVTPLQSFIRGSLARKHLNDLRNSKMLKAHFEEQVDTYKNQLQEAHEGMKELQNRALKAEAALQDKEEENLMLKQQIQQYESKWSDHEMKMKSMEEMWQQRMASLQISLVEAKRSVASNNKAQSIDHFDLKDTSQEFKTPDSTPAKHLRASTAILRISSNNNNSTPNAVSHMLKEFERKAKDFEDDARNLVEAKPGNPDEEIHKLKIRFKNWKKDYKIKLRATKAELHKLGNLESPKARRKWWSLGGAK